MQLHQNISDCLQVASSEVHCWDLPTSSAGLIRVQQNNNNKEEAVTIILHQLLQEKEINLQSQADLLPGPGEGEYTF